MTTTEVRQPEEKTRSWDSVTRWVMLAWVAVGFIYFVTHGSTIAPVLVYLWLGVQAVLTVAHIALSRPR